MKRNIGFFKGFVICVLMLFVGVMRILASGQGESLSGGSSYGAFAPDSSVLLSMDSIEISLLTCDPHDEVYSLYGHTAIRVQNHITHQDFAVNYGVFDSTVDHFVVRFVFGLTDYMMGIFDFDRFLDEYRYYGSAVYVQRINMKREEKLQFLSALAENARPENVVYRYNYFYDNCTTHARDMLLRCINGVVEYSPTPLQEGCQTYRSLVHLKTKDYPWAAFGNDALLGVGSDFETPHDGRQFLPEVLMQDFEKAKIKNADGTVRCLVDSSYCVLQSGTPYHNDDFVMPFRPRTCSLLFLCAVLALVLVQRFVIKRRLPWLEYSVCCIYGLVGMLLTAMIFSQHPTVSVNFQIFTMNPLLLVLAFPKFRWKYRWHLVMIFLTLFFVGGILQVYAEGMYIMACSLLIVTLNNIYRIEKEQ